MLGKYCLTGDGKHHYYIKIDVLEDSYDYVAEFTLRDFNKFALEFRKEIYLYCRKGRLE